MEQAPLYANAILNPGATWDAWSNPPTNTVRVRQVSLKIYTCPSDFTSANGFPTSQVNNWGGTSYQSNIHLFGTVGSPTAMNVWTITVGGVTQTVPNGTTYTNSRSSQFNIGNITDGTMNTVAFIEAYQQCNTQYKAWAMPSNSAGNHRLGPAAYNTHWATSNATAQTLMLTPPQFKPTVALCNPQTAQTAHDTIQVLMMDGAVRNTSSAVPGLTWALAILPGDGLPLPSNW
jgi:hypothetical protein